MSDKANLAIPFRIKKIETIQFAIIMDELEDDKLSTIISLGFGVSSSLDVVTCKFRYELLTDNKTALVIESAMNFGIGTTNNSILSSAKNRVIIPKGFATHLAMTTVGTTRGILHEKTKDSPLNDYPLPLIDITKKIMEDIELSPKESPETSQ
jgi:hypothetical protein